MYLQLIKWSPSLNFTSLLTVNNIDNTFYFFINTWFLIPFFIKVLWNIINIFIKVLNAIKFNLSKICLNLHFVYLVKIKGEDMFKISKGFTICYLFMCLPFFPPVCILTTWNFTFMRFTQTQGIDYMYIRHPIYVLNPGSV